MNSIERIRLSERMLQTYIEERKVYLKRLDEKSRVEEQLRDRIENAKRTESLKDPSKGNHIDKMV